MADPGAFTKLWWHGVDIAASVIAGAINAAFAAVAATLFWKFKKKRDLEFEREKIQLQATETRRLTNVANAEQNKLALEKKHNDRETIAKRIESSSTVEERHDAVRFASQWITSQGLNGSLNNVHASKILLFANNHPGNMNEKIGAQLAAEVRAIRFPEEYLPLVG